MKLLPYPKQALEPDIKTNFSRELIIEQLFFKRARRMDCSTKKYSSNFVAPAALVALELLLPMLPGPPLARECPQGLSSPRRPGLLQAAQGPARPFAGWMGEPLAPVPEEPLKCRVCASRGRCGREEKELAGTQSDHCVPL